MPDPKKISITVVVNGQPTVVDVIADVPLGTIISGALHQTENSGQPPENWELRDGDGNLLDLDKKIEDFGFPPKVRLFLNLKAGVGSWRYCDRTVCRPRGIPRQVRPRDHRLPLHRGGLPRPRLVPPEGSLACGRSPFRLEQDQAANDRDSRPIRLYEL